MTPLKDLTRTFAVAGKEALIILRRPSALATLVLGPVLILAVFGVSFVGQPPIRAVLVIPAGSGLPTSATAYDLGQPGVLDVVGVESTPDAARRDLHNGRADILVRAPNDAAAQLRAGKQVKLLVEYDTINPYQDAVIGRLAQPLAAKLNEKLAAEALAGGAVASAAPSGDAQVLTAPTTAEAHDLAPTPPRLVSFYGVAVLALILQHLGLTLGALSMTGDRRRGMLALLRVSPASAFELVLGKYIAFLVLVGVVAAALVILMITLLGVPMLASVGGVALMLALLVTAAIGMGLVLSLLSNSESQVIQLALLILIGSVFFGGLAIDLSQFVRPLQVFSEFLPVTQATRLGQDLFLRGATAEPWRYAALGAMAAILVIGAWLLLRRELQRRR